MLKSVQHWIWISLGGIPNSRNALFLLIFLKRAAKPSWKHLSWVSVSTKASQTFSKNFGTFSGTSLNLIRRLPQCTPELFWAEDLCCWWLKKRNGRGIGGWLKRGSSVQTGSARASSQVASNSFPLSANSQSVQRLGYKLYLYFSLLSLDSVYKLCSVLMLCPGRVASKTKTQAQIQRQWVEHYALPYPIESKSSSRQTKLHAGLSAKTSGECAVEPIQNDEARTKSSVTNVLKTCRSEKQRIANYFSAMVRNARSITAKCSIGEKSLIVCKIQKFGSV